MFSSLSIQSTSRIGLDFSWYVRLAGLLSDDLVPSELVQVYPCCATGSHCLCFVELHIFREASEWFANVSGTPRARTILTVHQPIVSCCATQRLWCFGHLLVDVQPLPVKSCIVICISQRSRLGSGASHHPHHLVRARRAHRQEHVRLPIPGESTGTAGHALL